MKPLPNFIPQDRHYVEELLGRILSHTNDDDETFLIELIQYEDHHFRVIFSTEYFQRDTPKNELLSPTKSQWNTLKKKLKRHDRRIFVFKEHGLIGQHAFLDFGFLKPK